MGSSADGPHRGAREYMKVAAELDHVPTQSL